MIGNLHVSRGVSVDRLTFGYLAVLRTRYVAGNRQSLRNRRERFGGRSIAAMREVGARRPLKSPCEPCRRWWLWHGRIAHPKHQRQLLSRRKVRRFLRRLLQNHLFSSMILREGRVPPPLLAKDSRFAMSNTRRIGRATLGCTTRMSLELNAQMNGQAGKGPLQRSTR